MRSHRHLTAIGEHSMRIVREFLDEAEDVIPAPAIQPGRMLTQLVENLIHLKAGQDSFNQHRALDRSLRQTDLLLRTDENVVPEPCLKMALHLRQIEIGPASA